MSRGMSGAAAVPPSAGKQIVRFQDTEGEEHFGSFTDVTQNSAHVYKRGASGPMKLTAEVKEVHAVLPPVDPPAIYCIGLNYVDHAAEVKMPIPAMPVVFMKAVTSLTGHKSA
jgi:2-keto-4-pentenoate hydratase/2-oxohepta-3-ene-1,7-dioic acid hydratase in catechol pathway